MSDIKTTLTEKFNDLISRRDKLYIERDLILGEIDTVNSMIDLIRDLVETPTSATPVKTEPTKKYSKRPFTRKKQSHPVLYKRSLPYTQLYLSDAVGSKVRDLMADYKQRDLQTVVEAVYGEFKHYDTSEYKRVSLILSQMTKMQYLVRVSKGIYRRSQRGAHLATPETKPASSVTTRPESAPVLESAPKNYVRREELIRVARGMDVITANHAYTLLGYREKMHDPAATPEQIKSRLGAELSNLANMGKFVRVSEGRYRLA